MARTRFTTTPDDGLVLDVVLSERNLWTLIAKLYTPNSRCTFLNNDCPPEISFVRFRAEPNEVHYDSPSRGLAQGYAGAMDPITEEIMLRIRPAIEAAVNEIGEPLAGAG